MRVGFVALLLVVLAAPARADDTRPDERAIGVVVQGGGTLRARVEDHLVARLRREGYSANLEPLSRTALDTLANCFILEDLVCARGVVEARAKTPRLVFARIDDATGAVALDFTWFSAGRLPVAAKRSCSECTATWQAHTDELLGTLLASAEMPVLVEPEPATDRPREPRSRLWPTLLISAGAATLVAGGALLYVGLRDGPAHKYTYPQLTPVGISLIAVGGGAMIGGIITW